MYTSCCRRLARGRSPSYTPLTSEPLGLDGAAGESRTIAASASAGNAFHVRMYTFGLVTRRTRIFAFGLTLALVLAGSASAALVGGVTGQVLTIVLISAGVAGAVLLVFLEIGFSEDRELARDAERRRGRAMRRLAARRGRWVTRRPRRPGS
jgi:hypothetical protein